MRTFTFKTLRNNYSHHIEHVLGLDSYKLEQDYASYAIKQPAASDRDYMWHLFNGMLLASGTDYVAQSAIYHSMAVFVAVYEGKNGNQYKRMSLQAEVNKAREDYMLSRLDMVLKVIADPECAHAQTMEAKSFPLDKEFVLPLANEHCEREFCRCTTSCVGKRDKNGRLVMKP